MFDSLWHNLLRLPFTLLFFPSSSQRHPSHSPILFNSVTDETVNKVSGQNRTYENNNYRCALIRGKEENETEGNLNQWNLIVKEYGLKMNMDKLVTDDSKEPAHKHQHKS
jgi:hypothetical protein